LQRGCDTPNCFGETLKAYPNYAKRAAMKPFYRKRDRFSEFCKT